MKKNSVDPDIKNFLCQFSAKSKKKKIVYSDKAVTYNRCSTKKQDSIGWQKKSYRKFRQ